MTKKPKAKTPLRRDAFSVLAREVGRYLKAQGWTALVVGNPRIQHAPHERAFNHEFVLRFTGGKRGKKKP